MRVRPWAGWADLPGMQAVLAEGLRDAPPGVTYEHPGDIAWWIGWEMQVRDDEDARIRIWDDDGRILGWAVADDGDVGEYVHPSVLDDPGAAAFLDAVDGWLTSLGRSVTRYVREDDDRAVRRLAAAGWVPDADGGFHCYTLDLTAMEGERDPRVRPMARDEDPAGRLGVMHDAFGSSTSLAADVEDYRAFMASPAYPDGWDLVARTDEGEAAACCIAWPDPVSRVGVFEPVATHPRYVRRGFGGAAVREGLRRLGAAGMSRAIVRAELDNPAADAFYRSLGFVQTHVERAYVRA